MRSPRTLILIVVVALFVVVGGAIAFARSSGGGQARTIDLAITGSKMSPEVPTARQGDTLTVNVTADKQEEIHLHGYDRKFEVKPGEKVSQTFKADKSGTFEIEIEDSSTHLGNLQVNP